MILQIKIISFVALAVLGCQTPKKIQFEPSSQGAKGIQVSLVEFGRTDQGGEPLGTLPVEIEISKVSGKSLRLSSPGYDDQFWVFPDKLGEANIVKIKLKRRIDDGEKLAALQAKSSLLLMKSYKALVEKNLELAENLANQSEKILSLGPGALIIKAIATWQNGDIKGAKLLIEEARALYPNTGELDELLEAVKRQ